MFSRLKSSFAVVLVCAATLAGCATKPAAFSHQDPQADLYAYKTFAFFEPAPHERVGSGYSTPVATQLRAATRAQLEKLGYTYDPSHPDLRVNIMLAVGERTEVRSTPATVAPRYRAWGATNVETVNYREGTLAVDLVDTQRRAMVWRGVVQDRITKKDMQNVDETVRAAVKEVFARYPAKA